MAVSGHSQSLPTDPHLRLLVRAASGPSSTAASGTGFARARARARANPDGYSLDQTLASPSLGQSQGLSALALPSLRRHFAPDTLPHLPSCHKDHSTLTGWSDLCSAGKNRRLQKLSQSYQIVKAGNWPARPASNGTESG